MKNKKTWNQKVATWALRYLSELSAEDLQDFNERLTISRNMTFSECSRYRPLPACWGREIKLSRYEKVGPK